jgi:hypothetical protein
MTTASCQTASCVTATVARTWPALVRMISRQMKMSYPPPVAQKS